MNAEFVEIFGDLWTRHVRSSDESNGFSLGRVQHGRFTCFAADDKERLVTRSEHKHMKKRRKSWEREFHKKRSIRLLFGEDAIKRDEQAWQESKRVRVRANTRQRKWTKFVQPQREKNAGQGKTLCVTEVKTRGLTSRMKVGVIL